MATDVEVQFFSRLNGLTLGNNWGDLIRLLDKALVTGIDFTQITSASIDAQGDVHITLYAAHNAMLLQVVELSGFAPASLNQKYRIKGVPSATELILKPHTAIVETSITTVGAGKLASLGYDIVFRDTNDVKRVYRAKNPTSQHPFIRVDESLTDGTNSYNSSYAKFAMVGLLEHMDHIDDYENPDVLQLPFSPSDPAKNWKIAGTGASVRRGWSHWYWATNNINGAYITQAATPINGNRAFTLVGGSDAFYINASMNTLTTKVLWGCGVFEPCIDYSTNPQWFLMSALPNNAANFDMRIGDIQGFAALTINSTAACFHTTPTSSLSKASLTAVPILPDYSSGFSNIYSANTIAALEIPFKDAANYLRGTLKHVCYMGKRVSTAHTSPIIAGNAMYVVDNVRHTDNSISNAGDTGGAVYYYLGELE